MSDFNINKRFDFLKQLTTMVALGVTPSLIVTGEGGLGKTHTVQSTLNDLDCQPEDYTVFKGYSTPRGLYNSLYDNNGKILIFDDYDSVLENKVSLNILKSALDSYDKRTITWSSMKSSSDEYPNSFEFTGTIIFISNKSSKDIDGAILSRSIVVDLSMTAEDKISRMGSIINDIMPTYDIKQKMAALKFLDKNKDGIELSIRSLIKVTKVVATYPDNWEDLATFMVKG
jgi:hypothetical protein